MPHLILRRLNELRKIGEPHFQVAEWKPRAIYSVPKLSVVWFCFALFSPPYCSHVPSTMHPTERSLCLLCSTHSHMQNALPSRGKERFIIDIVHICQCVETVKSRLSFIIAVLKFSTDHTSASFLHPGRQPLPIIGTPMCIGQTKPTAMGNTPKYQTIFLHNNSLSVTSQCV